MRRVAGPRGAPAPGLAARALAVLFAAYKRWLSPWLPRSCRFSPTCSEYARLAVIERGAALGLTLAAGRLVRCQPLARGGIDLP